MTSRSNHIIAIKQGNVKGATVKNVDGGEFLVFDTIPYAQPPLGQLRFRDPLPPKATDGICNPKSTIIKPVQYDMIMQYFTGTEDCLYLNVVTKSVAGKKPVMAWFHGGGFVMGSGSIKLFSPDYLIKQDIVFVSVDYRLGCFGFLNLDLPDASGNQGMKDIVASLKWIQENIEAFGGDPENVTIFGESAGSVAVHLITLSPLGKGLFHKAIAQSGVCTNAWSFTENPVELGLRLATIVAKRQINDTNEALDIFMEASSDQLIQAQRKMNPRQMDYECVFNFVPSIDSKSLNPFMPEHPVEMYKRGINVPLIIGCTSDEGIIAAVNPEITKAFEEINTNFAAVVARYLGIRDTCRIEKIINSVKKFYLGETDVMSSKTVDTYVRLFGDVNFYNGIQQVIEIQSKLSTPTYFYRFSHRPSYPTLCTILNSNIKGTGHGDEIGALFHSPCYSGNKGLQKRTRDYLVMERLTQMWTNFAKTGNPTVKLDDKLTIKWEPITKDELFYLDISEKLESKVNFRETAWKFWKPILETL